jgi:glycosyltransferase involved in cell wall biosynthesis
MLEEGIPIKQMFYMRPISIPAYIKQKFYLQEPPETTCLNIKNAYQQLQKAPIEVSIVIPAYNEENNILRTLSSLASNITNRSIEIIVVNNNSKDRTKELVEACGIPCVLETVQKISAARNAGLDAAKGKYILTADADSIYPEQWIELMLAPMASNEIALVYGSFSFIPTEGTPRLVYFCYEYLADFTRWLNKTFKEEAVNVYGFNCGFRKEQAIAVDGHHFPPGASEDGWLAVKLRDKGFGKLNPITNPKALVWTTDRRIQSDGGLFKAIIKRMRRLLGLSIVTRTDV